MALELDPFDKAILDIVEQDATRSPREIAKLVNLSASSVRRRLAALRQKGVILREIALTDPATKGLAFWTMVSFGEESKNIYDSFRQQMINDPAVSQCYSISGEADFLVMVHATSPEAFEAWGEENLMQNPSIRRYTTSVIWSHTKFTTRAQPATLDG